MNMRVLRHWLCCSVLCIGLLWQQTAFAGGVPPLEIVGMYKMFPTQRQTVAGTPVYGLSGIDCTPSGECIAVSDDRSFDAPARWYQFKLNIARDFATPTNRQLMHIDSVTAMLNQQGDVYAQGTIDAEGITRLPNGNILVSSEGWINRQVPASLTEYTTSGQWVRAWPLPAFMQMQPKHGFFDNKALEGLTHTPNGQSVWVAAERPLQQEAETPYIRLVQYHTATATAAAAYAYALEPAPDGYANNGVSEMLALDDASFLVLERADKGNRNDFFIRIYKTTVQPQSSNVLTCDALPACGTITPVSKTLIAEWPSVYPDGTRVDNLEGMTFGPPLPDGRQTLVLISDDNKNPAQETQIAIFAVPSEGF